uniref:Exosome complex RNA-binding protein Csl4 n=1 Tax=uncultured organism TaxID=155900 RepID=M1PPF6_9ZZZZ|nr:exosome complex RNA-binding protein Csl4 [uncultured organism]
MEELDKEVVYPGDELGTSEEWLPGEGTYEEDGIVYSALFGKLKYDEENLEAKVEAINPITELKEGVVVYGKVTNRKESLVSLNIEVLEGKSRDIARDIEGSIHISRVSDDYTEDMESQYLVGDIVRAKVVRIEPSIRLTTVGKSLGVVRAYCGECKSELVTKKGKSQLYCPVCERHVPRKLSSYYGKIKLKEK